MAASADTAASPALRALLTPPLGLRMISDLSRTAGASDSIAASGGKGDPSSTIRMR